MTQHNTRLIVRLSPLLVLLALALFPYGWLAEHVPWIDYLANVLFATEAAHAVGHAAIFALVGGSLLAVFPALRGRPVSYGALILLVALAQEGFQLLYKGRGVTINDITDIGTDLVAAAVVFTLVRLATVQRKRARGDTADPSFAG